MIRIFGYVRESTMQQVVHGYNIEEQKRSIENYCRNCYKDYDLFIYEDRGKSATTLNRPELQNLLDEAKHAKAQIIIFHSIDRLARNIEDLIYLMKFFKQKKIEVISVMESVEMDTAIGRNQFLHSGLYAQLESERTSERTIRALKQGVTEGKYPFPCCPLGYRKVDKKLHLSDNQQEIDIVRYLFKTIAGNYFNYSELCVELKKKFNIRYDHIRLKKLISNRVYTGVMEYRGIIVENYCEPLIDTETFEMANNNMHIKKHSRRNVNYLFKNIVKCVKCSCYMTQTAGTGRHKIVYTYYICPKCGGKVSQRKIVERKYAELQGLSNRYFKDKEGYSDKKDEIRKLRKKQRQLIEAQKMNAIDIDTFYEVYINYDELIGETEAAIEKIENKGKAFGSLSAVIQKDIIYKYVHSVDIFFNGKKYGISIVLKEDKK